MTGQETLDEAMAPETSRIWQHTGCGGWVTFRLDGGHCLRCGAFPVSSGDYAKPGSPLPVAEPELQPAATEAAA